MNTKLITQIKNEWRSNLWLVTELLLVSVVLWYIVDYMYVKTSIYNQPKGFDISHCYLVQMGCLTDKSPDFIPNQTEEEKRQDVKELLSRLQHRPDIEAAGLGQNSYPYNGGNSGASVVYDTLRSPGWTVRRLVTPDFVRVFRYCGTRGETPEQLAEMLKDSRNFLASDNLYKQRYGRDLTSLVGKPFYLFGDTTNTWNLAASLQVIRYGDYFEAWNSYSMLAPISEAWYSKNLELCVRVKEDQDQDFIARLKADSEKQYRVGNLFIADVRSFVDIRRNYQQAETNTWNSYLFGMGFLLLNIFLGLLGTFWFRTQQRRSEIALMKSLGGTDRSVCIRLVVEGLLLLAVATVPAMLIDWNLANVELNSWMDGSTFSWSRFLITVLFTFILIALMIVVGVGIPARKAMKVQPAEALHDE
ncbi:FtsX-like permease family protein [Phocaeicola sp.]|uniref:ABC transporter permease n=1 Tax=Phocaeicola sp. TaxID=2773926 RepID=UPI0023C924AB|nr:FtsX-like permease family protein [Phocaeicola sp.]MDE5676743.1 FtsX-like permease family protein [Phocaeicola sp.]